MADGPRCKRRKQSNPRRNNALPVRLSTVGAAEASDSDDEDRLLIAEDEPSPPATPSGGDGAASADDGDGVTHGDKDAEAGGAASLSDDASGTDGKAQAGGREEDSAATATAAAAAAAAAGPLGGRPGEDGLSELLGRSDTAVVYPEDPEDTPPRRGTAAATAAAVQQRQNGLVTELGEGFPRLLPCPYCERGYKRLASLKDHIRHRHHGGDDDDDDDVGGFACSQCSSAFPTRGQLERHSASHRAAPPSQKQSGSRKFSCTECGKAFKYKHHLKEHFRIHSGEKPYECPHCKKRFSHSGSYSSHISSMKCVGQTVPNGRSRTDTAAAAVTAAATTTTTAISTTACSVADDDGAAAAAAAAALVQVAHNGVAPAPVGSAPAIAPVVSALPPKPLAGAGNATSAPPPPPPPLLKSPPPKTQPPQAPPAPQPPGLRLVWPAPGGGAAGPPGAFCRQMAPITVSVASVVSAPSVGNRFPPPVLALPAPLPIMSRAPTLPPLPSVSQPIQQQQQQQQQVSTISIQALPMSAAGASLSSPHPVTVTTHTIPMHPHSQLTFSLPIKFQDVPGSGGGGGGGGKLLPEVLKLDGCLLLPQDVVGNLVGLPGPFLAGATAMQVPQGVLVDPGLLGLRGLFGREFDGTHEVVRMVSLPQQQQQQQQLAPPPPPPLQPRPAPFLPLDDVALQVLAAPVPRPAPGGGSAGVLPGLRHGPGEEETAAPPPPPPPPLVLKPDSDPERRSKSGAGDSPGRPRTKDAGTGGAAPVPAAAPAEREGGPDRSISDLVGLIRDLLAVLKALNSKLSGEDVSKLVPFPAHFLNNGGGNGGTGWTEVHKLSSFIARLLEQVRADSAGEPAGAVPAGCCCEASVRASAGSCAIEGCAKPVAPAQPERRDGFKRLLAELDAAGAVVVGEGDGAGGDAGEQPLDLTVPRVKRMKLEPELPQDGGGGGGGDGRADDEETAPDDGETAGGGGAVDRSCAAQAEELADPDDLAAAPPNAGRPAAAAAPPPPAPAAGAVVSIAEPTGFNLTLLESAPLIVTFLPGPAGFVEGIPMQATALSRPGMPQGVTTVTYSCAPALAASGRPATESAGFDAEDGAASGPDELTDSDSGGGTRLLGRLGALGAGSIGGGGALPLAGAAGGAVVGGLVGGLVGGVAGGLAGGEAHGFPCDLCDKTFQKSSSLLRHKYEHTGKRPHECQVCAKAFKHKHHLIEHSRLHSGEKPYRCDRCGKRFSHSGSYSQHMNHRYSYCNRDGGGGGGGGADGLAAAGAVAAGDAGDAGVAVGTPQSLAAPGDVAVMLLHNGAGLGNEVDDEEDVEVKSEEVVRDEVSGEASGRVEPSSWATVEGGAVVPWMGEGAWNGGQGEAAAGEAYGGGGERGDGGGGRGGDGGGVRGEASLELGEEERAFGVERGLRRAQGVGDEREVDGGVEGADLLEEPKELGEEEEEGEEGEQLGRAAAAGAAAAEEVEEFPREDHPPTDDGVMVTIVPDEPGEELGAIVARGGDAAGDATPADDDADFIKLLLTAAAATTASEHPAIRGEHHDEEEEEEEGVLVVIEEEEAEELEEAIHAGGDPGSPPISHEEEEREGQMEEQKEEGRGGHNHGRGHVGTTGARGPPTGEAPIAVVVVVVTDTPGDPTDDP
uniref:Uncharacterized protein LOC116954665 n=1 Tax=Petromyzon marinus TaxID=7757 RepID=A0AAJ7U9Q2_PETMA|nr:uncharacterized protein LOC116954665 [Petromyzon marinus]